MLHWQPVPMEDCHPVNSLLVSYLFEVAVSTNLLMNGRVNVIFSGSICKIKDFG